MHKSTLVGFFLLFTVACANVPTWAAARSVLEKCDFTARRLSAFADGNLSLVEALFQSDVASSIAGAGRFSALYGGEESLREALESKRYAGFMGSYAIVRSASIGMCEDRGIDFVEKITTTTTYRNLLNTIRRSSSETKSGITFEVPAKFSDIVRAGKNSGSVNNEMFNTFREFFREHGCSSVTRKKIENNMIAFYSGACFGCINGKAPPIKDFCAQEKLRKRDAREESRKEQIKGWGEKFNEHDF